MKPFSKVWMQIAIFATRWNVLTCSINRTICFLPNTSNFQMAFRMRNTLIAHVLGTLCCREYFHLNLFINMYKPTITHMMIVMQRVIEEPVKTMLMSSTNVTCLIVRHFSLLDSSKQYLKNETIFISLD